MFYDPREEFGDLSVKLDAFLRCLFLEDRDTRIELGRLNVGDHPRFEAAHEALLEARDAMRINIRGDDDLLPLLVERVERMEEDLLGMFTRREELNIVHQEHIAMLAIARVEFVGAVVLER